VPAEQALPLVVFFEPPLPAEFTPQAELLTALPVKGGDERYLKAKLQTSEASVDAAGRKAIVQGTVSLPENSPPAGQIWLAAVAYGADGEVVGIRKWEAILPPPAAATGTAALGTPDQAQLAASSPTPPSAATGTPPAPENASPLPTNSGPALQLPGPLEAGENLSFEITVFSLGPRIDMVEVVAEARP
jgi:hypothetical protein